MNHKIERARAELAFLRARHDDGAVSQAVYAIIKKLEADISWLEYTPTKEKRK